MQRVPVRGVIPITEMRGQTDEESVAFRELEAEARSFLKLFSWCGEIRELYFGGGRDRMICIFLALIAPTRPDVDEWLWVFVGDTAPAYLVTTYCKSPREALLSYIEEMRKWVAAARQGTTSRELIPVNAPPTPENAELLNSKLDALEKALSLGA